LSDRSIGEVSSAILDRALSTPVAHRPPCVPLRSARIAAGRPRCVLGPFDLRFEAAEVECVERSGRQIFFPRYVEYPFARTHSTAILSRSPLVSSSELRRPLGAMTYPR